MKFSTDKCIFVIILLPFIKIQWSEKMAVIWCKVYGFKIHQLRSIYFDEMHNPLKGIYDSIYDEYIRQIPNRKSLLKDYHKKNLIVRAWHSWCSATNKVHSLILTFERCLFNFPLYYFDKEMIWNCSVVTCTFNQFMVELSIVQLKIKRNSMNNNYIDKDRKIMASGSSTSR